LVVVQLEVLGDKCSQHLAKGVVPSVLSVASIILGFAYRALRYVINVGSQDILKGIARYASRELRADLRGPRPVVGSRPVALAGVVANREDVADVLRLQAEFAHNANVKLSALQNELAISVPTGEIFKVGTVYRDSMVLVGDVFLEADLIPLEMVDLDVILGMDWLAKHHASVDCFRKEVVIRSPGRPEVTFCGERRVLPSCLISAMTSNTLAQKGVLRLFGTCY
ncbi:unnamed protein product, partial [Prunus brigantina]